MLAVNLGKWILRFLFARLIDEEYTRDAKFRHDLVASTSKPTSLQRDNAPSSIQLPLITTEGSQVLMNADDALITPRPTNGMIKPAMTPGLTIGTATPALNGTTNSNRPPTAEDGTALEKRISQLSQSRTSMDRSSDYFTSNNQAKSPSEAQPKTPGPPGEPSSDTGTQSPVDGEKEEKSKEGGSLFGKGFRMKFPKKLGRTSTDVKPAVVDEKSEESDKSEEKEDKTIQDSFYGCIQKIRYEYEERMQNDPSYHLSSGITPSPLSETPILRLPPFTTVIIQDERPDSGGVADLYRGTVSSVGQDADLIEKVAPTWLGDLLLKVFKVHSPRHCALADSTRIKCLQKRFRKSPLYSYRSRISCRALQVLMGKLGWQLESSETDMLICMQKFTTQCKSYASSEKDPCICC